MPSPPFVHSHRLLLSAALEVLDCLLVGLSFTLISWSSLDVKVATNPLQSTSTVDPHIPALLLCIIGEVHALLDLLCWALPGRHIFCRVAFHTLDKILTWFLQTGCLKRADLSPLLPEVSWHQTTLKRKHKTSCSHTLWDFFDTTSLKARQFV